MGIPAAAFGPLGLLTKSAMDSAYRDQPGVETVATPGMDQQTQAGVDAQRTHAERGLSEFAGDTTHGITEGTMLQNGGGLSLGGNDGMNDALSRRAQKSYDREINNISTNANLGASGKKMDALAHAGSLAGQQLNAANSRQDFAHAQYNRKIAEQANREAARNQVLSSVLGFAGMAAGAVIGGMAGGGVGAGIGAAAGSKLGGLAGPTDETMMGGEPTAPAGKYFA